MRKVPTTINVLTAYSDLAFFDLEASITLRGHFESGSVVGATATGVRQRNGEEAPTLELMPSKDPSVERTLTWRCTSCAFTGPTLDLTATLESRREYLLSLEWEVASNSYDPKQRSHAHGFILPRTANSVFTRRLPELTRVCSGGGDGGFAQFADQIIASDTVTPSIEIAVHAVPVHFLQDARSTVQRPKAEGVGLELIYSYDRQDGETCELEFWDQARASGNQDGPSVSLSLITSGQSWEVTKKQKSDGITLLVELSALVGGIQFLFVTILIVIEMLSVPVAACCAKIKMKAEAKAKARAKMMDEDADIEEGKSSSSDDDSDSESSSEGHPLLRERRISRGYGVKGGKRKDDAGRGGGKASTESAALRAELEAIRTLVHENAMLHAKVSFHAAIPPHLHIESFSPTSLTLCTYRVSTIHSPYPQVREHAKLIRTLYAGGEKEWEKEDAKDLLWSLSTLNVSCGEEEDGAPERLEYLLVGEFTMADSRLLANAARPTWQRKAVHGEVVSIYYSRQRWFIGIRSAGEVLARSANKSESNAPTDVAWQVCSGPSSWREEEWLSVRPPDKESPFAAFGKILKLSHSAAKEKASADKEALRRSTIAIQNSNPMGLEMAKLKEKFRGEEKEVNIYPRGWTGGVDDETGEVIYVNEFTGDTITEEPKLPAPPIGFSVGTDESGHVFFNNLETGESQWTHPLGEPTSKKKTRSTLPPGRLKSMFIKQSPPKKGDDAAAANALPRGWTAAESDEGHPYYTNEFTGDPVWEQPTLPAEPEGWSVAAEEDDESKFVWTNLETGEEKKEHPEGELVVEKKAKNLRLKALMSRLKKPKKTKEEEYPRGWSSAESDEGHTYYHNDHTVRCVCCVRTAPHHYSLTSSLLPSFSFPPEILLSLSLSL